MGVTDSSHAARITTSRRQGQGREDLSEGSRSAKVRAEGHELHRRLSLRASQHWMTKPTDAVDRVNAAVVHGKFMLLLGEICLGWRCERDVESQKGLLAEQDPGAAGCCDLAASERHSRRQCERSALQSNLWRYWTEVSSGRSSYAFSHEENCSEGPNMKNKSCASGTHAWR